MRAEEMLGTVSFQSITGGQKLIWNQVKKYTFSHGRKTFKDLKKRYPGNGKMCILRIKKTAKKPLAIRP